MERDSGVAFIGKLDYVVLFFLMLPEFYKGNYLTKKRVVGSDDPDTRENIVTMLSVGTLLKAMDARQQLIISGLYILPMDRIVSWKRR